MAGTVLYIGNKCFSSWSLRPWIALKAAGVVFEERLIRLRQPDTAEKIRAVSPHGKVPLLIHEGVSVWESIAIIEYVADTFPEAGLWPDSREAKAHCRSIAAEMHGGFVEVRKQWGMNLRRKPAHKPLEGDGIAQGARIEAIWAEARARFGAGGPYLFGRFSVADAMYAPVVTRFDRFGGELSPVTRAYCDAVLSHPAMRQWQREADAETWPEPDPNE